MKTFAVEFWTEGGTLVVGELVNSSIVMTRENGQPFLRIERTVNQEVDVVSAQGLALCAYKVPVTRIRAIRPVLVSA